MRDRSMIADESGDLQTQIFIWVILSLVFLYIVVICWCLLASFRRAQADFNLDQPSPILLHRVNANPVTSVQTLYCVHCNMPKSAALQNNDCRHEFVEYIPPDTHHDTLPKYT